MMPVKLYKEEVTEGKRKTVEITEDGKPGRITLLNDDTGDTLDGIQFKRAIVRDYLLNGNVLVVVQEAKNRAVAVNKLFIVPNSQYFSIRFLN